MRIKASRLLWQAAILAGGALLTVDAWGSSAGVIDRAWEGSAGCEAGCHGPSPGNIASVVISGPTQLQRGESATYTITATQVVPQDGVKMGIGIATSNAISPLSTIAGQHTVIQGDRGELTHTTPNDGLHVTSAGSASYRFTYTMHPEAPFGWPYRIYGVAALSFSGWKHATPLVVTAVPPPPPPPSDLTVVTVSDTTVRFTWSGGGPEYLLVYKPGPVPPENASDGTRVNPGALTAWTVGGLLPATEYSFRIYSNLLHSLVVSSTGPAVTLRTSPTPVPRFVDAAAGTNTGNCASSTSPCKTITYAMSQVAPGDPIHVRPGTYRLASGEVFPILLKPGVQLQGMDPATTIIDAEGDTVMDGILRSSGNVWSSATISGLTLRNGRRSAAACDASPLGGALHISDSTATFTVTRNVFENNEALGYAGCGASGGAIAVVASTVHITNNIFRGNTAHGGSGAPGAPGGQGAGGAIHFIGTGRVANNTFYGNRAIGGNGVPGGGGRAGALNAPESTAPAIVNNIFAANAASSGAGGSPDTSTAGAILAPFAATPFSNNLFHGNLANGSASTGDSPGAASVNGDPFFYSAPADLHISLGSPAARSGTNTLQIAPSEDHDRAQRPNPPSIGAFEPTRFFDPLPPRLSNISTRGPVQTQDHVLIGGFIIGGATPKTVIMRARGPMMLQFGIADVLHNPQLRLFSGQTQIAFNDDWADAPNSAAIQASGYAPEWPSEAAILTTLSPGPYTAIVSGWGNTTGIGIFEVFEIDEPTVPLLNISTRGPVLTQDHVLIGGFIVLGNGPQTVLLRARGPSMAEFNVPNLLGNPRLTLYSGQSPIASNDNWTDAPNAAQIQATGLAPQYGVESAILTTLDPGAYTAIVTGVGNTTGIAIVEVFKVN